MEQHGSTGGYKKGERFKKNVVDILDGKVKLYRTTSDVYQGQIWISEEQKAYLCNANKVYIKWREGIFDISR